MNADDYNKALAEKQDELNRYRQSLAEEFTLRKADIENERFKAKEVFQSAIERIANELVNLATNGTSESTRFKASKFIYERVVGDTDNPEEDELTQMLESLKKPLTPVHEDYADIKPETTEAQIEARLTKRRGSVTRLPDVDDDMSTPKPKRGRPKKDTQAPYADEQDMS